MKYRELSSALAECESELQRAVALVGGLNSLRDSGVLPARVGNCVDELVESAFLKTFKAWEVFAEGAFILYMCGKAPPKGARPRRFALPPTRQFAVDWLIPEKGTYTTWADLEDLKKRSKKFFQDGRPFYPALAAHGNVLAEATTIRSAIAHPSENARRKFQNLVRNKIGSFPRGSAPARF